MNVSLTPQLEEIIRKKVESGMYGNASEVVREALRLMDYQDRLNRLRADIVEADAEFERGEYFEFTADYFDRLQDTVDQGIEPDPNVVP